MIKLEGLSNSEILDISKQIADAFYDYKYNESDQGLSNIYQTDKVCIHT